METIYDYNPTKEEWEQLGYIPREKYEDIVDDDCRYYDLAILFYNRGMKRMMNKYIRKVKNIDMRNSFFRTIYHS